MEISQPRRVTAWFRYLPQNKIHKILFGCAVLGLTRGILYTFPIREAVPRGLDLLPNWLLYCYGVMWLLSSMNVMVQIRSNADPAHSSKVKTRQDIARRLLAGMFICWAISYFSGVLYPPDHNRVYPVIIALFFAVLGYIVLQAEPEEPRVVHEVIFMVHGVQDGEPSSLMLDETEMHKLIQEQNGSDSRGETDGTG